MSCDVEVVVGAEENDACVVEVVDTDVSKEEDIVVESETVSNVGVDDGWLSTGAADTGDSPVAAFGLSPSCPEIVDS